MSVPQIFYDPTSEPCRAVHWLCLEATIPHELKYIWLTRNEHLSEDFLAVNPFHQVPALKHGEFCLSEATAIMLYLTEINGCSNDWFGEEIERKAIISKHLSWYHTNLRKKLTLDYFLPVLLMPAYHGLAKPTGPQIADRKNAMHTMLEQLDRMLLVDDFLSGSQIASPDILFAADVVALQIDPSYDDMLAKYDGIRKWLTTLQAMPSYKQSHKVWEHIAPFITNAITKPQGSPEWIAEACQELGS